VTDPTPRRAWNGRTPHAPACLCPGCDVPAGPGRRGFLAVALGGAASLLAAPALAQSQTGMPPGPRRLLLRRNFTEDRFEGVYWSDGGYDREALRRLDWVMRDLSASEVTPMDPRLFDVLFQVSHRLGAVGREYQIHSGYRTPETNAVRRRQSRGVAPTSLHMSGMACDLRLEGFDPLGLARSAAQMQLGGVGFYRQGFVHLDCGPVRRW
jgi:uncharacterized protein YcbK (DUF882 family)